MPMHTSHIKNHQWKCARCRRVVDTTTVKVTSAVSNRIQAQGTCHDCGKVKVRYFRRAR